MGAQLSYVLVSKIHFFFSGKGTCDRKSAVAKGEVRRHVDEKNDCCNSIQFVAAAKSTQHFSIFACNVSDKNKNKINLPNITKFNNIEFKLNPVKHTSRSTTIPVGIHNELSMTTWRAFQLGIGKTIKSSNIVSKVNNIETLEIIAQHSNTSWKTEKTKKGHY